jgi:hypothetical protein
LDKVRKERLSAICTIEKRKKSVNVEKPTTNEETIRNLT